MSGIAVLTYLVAFAAPVYLLRRFHTHHAYWHILAIVAALVAGAIPVPQESKPPGFDLAFGFLVVALLVWGVGGLVTRLPHREKHA